MPVGRRLHLGALVLAALLSCKRSASPAPAPATPTRAALPKASALLTPDQIARQMAEQGVKPGHPATSEVEISGRVVVPAKHATDPLPRVFVAQGDCLASGAKMVGYAGADREGRVFVEVVVPWGADLTMCAAIEPTPGAVSRVWGKAATPMRAEEREVEFTGVVITLAEGEAKRFEHLNGAP